MRPLILDLDGSLGPFPDARVLPMRQHEQALRFACSHRALQRFAQRLDAELLADDGTVFTGSGDFHHLSLPLIAHAARRHSPLQVVVFDNHPDNMRFPFAVHCGSWVRRATTLPGVTHVHVVGITSTDISRAHAWENRLWPLLRKRLTYWSCGVDVGWAHRLGLGQAFRGFDTMPELLQAFTEQMRRSTMPVYLSIDKDVLSVEDARTNWDQGCMRESELCVAIEALRERIVGSDITGEVSAVTYRQWWKRTLSALDSQPPVPADELAQWQAAQHALNVRLLRGIDGCLPHGSTFGVR